MEKWETLGEPPTHGTPAPEQARLAGQCFPGAAGCPLLLCSPPAGPGPASVHCQPGLASELSGALQARGEALSFFLLGFTRHFLVTSDFKGSRRREDRGQTPVCDPSPFLRQDHCANSSPLSRRDSQPLLSDLTKLLTFSSEP